MKENKIVEGLKKISKKTWFIIGGAVAVAVVLIVVILALTLGGGNRKNIEDADQISNPDYRALYVLKESKLQDTDAVKQMAELTWYYRYNAEALNRDIVKEGHNDGLVITLKKTSSLYEIQREELEQQANVILHLVPDLEYVEYTLNGAGYARYQQYGKKKGNVSVMQNDDEMKQHTKDAKSFETYMQKLRPRYAAKSIDGVLKNYIKAKSDINGDSVEIYLHGYATVSNQAWNNNQIRIQALTSKGKYRFINGDLLRTESIRPQPAIFLVDKAEDGLYELAHVDHHPLVDDLERAIREMYPKQTADRAISEMSNKITKLQKAEEELGNAYLEANGRIGKVGLLSEQNLKYLDNGILSEENMQKILGDTKLINYPLWLGSQEFVEDGKQMVYSTSYIEQENAVFFKKYERGNIKDVLELYKIDVTTGDYVGIG